MKTFVRELKKRGGHVLQIITGGDGRKLLYYSEYGDYAMQARIKSFNDK